MFYHIRDLRRICPVLDCKSMYYCLLQTQLNRLQHVEDTFALAVTAVPRSSNPDHILSTPPRAQSTGTHRIQSYFHYISFSSLLRITCGTSFLLLFVLLITLIFHHHPALSPSSCFDPGPLVDFRRNVFHFRLQTFPFVKVFPL